MDDASMVGILMMFFGAAFYVFAGLAAIDPDIMRIFLARVHGAFNEEHPKEFSRMWAKGLCILGLGPLIGGLAMYLFGGAGGFVLLVSFVFFTACCIRYISRETKKLKEEDEPEEGTKESASKKKMTRSASGPDQMKKKVLVCGFCGGEFPVGTKNCPYCSAPAENASMR
ncbi:MAG: hypothetical protein K6G83_07095, partial [Lachnospiraceae bacterium]|nr:hypothetical protein [Lachnospiraceae bacterium]